MKKLTKLALLAGSTFVAPYQASAEGYKMCVEDPSKGTASFDEVKCLINRLGMDSGTAHTIVLQHDDGSVLSIGYKEGDSQLYTVVEEPRHPRGKVRTAYIDEDGDGSLDSFIKEKFLWTGSDWRRQKAYLVADGQVTRFGVNPKTGQAQPTNSRALKVSEGGRLEKDYRKLTGEILGYAITQDSLASLDQSTEKLADAVEEAAKVLETDEFDAKIKELRDTIPTADPQPTAENKPTWEL
jgi:hypothetical protein